MNNNIKYKKYIDSTSSSDYFYEKIKQQHNNNSLKTHKNENNDILSPALKRKTEIYNDEISKLKNALNRLNNINSNSNNFKNINKISELKDIRKNCIDNFKEVLQ